MQRFDLIIVGGGLVGAGLAVALRSSGYRIALIDSRMPSSDDPRLFALNSTSCQFLENLKLWPQLAPHASPIQEVHVSHRGHFGSVRLRSQEVQLPQLGYVIPARYIEAALNDALTTLPDCTVYRPAKLERLSQDHQSVFLEVSSEAGNKTLEAPIVIGADGTESTVRSQLSIKTDIFEYQQSAIVTRTTLKRSHHHIAHERFIEDGAIAMLPLTENECATIWSGSNSSITALMDLSDENFLQALQAQFGYRSGRFEKISQRHVFPLRMVRAEKAVEGGVLLLGNSAHTLHPIAAQGFNLAIFEVAALAEAMMEKKSQQAEFTSADLQAINERTQKQQATSMGVSHRLSRLFSHSSAILSLGVQIGMVGLDAMTPIKKRFIESIMGRSGRIPRLLLSESE